MSQSLMRYARVLEIVGDILKVQVPDVGDADEMLITFDDLGLVEDPSGFRSLARGRCG